MDVSHDLLFCPRDQVVKIQNNQAQMALKVETDADPMHENSLDDSADSELLGMVDEGSFGSAEPQYLDSSKDDGTATSYHFKDISGGVTYKIFQMGDDGVNTIIPHSPSDGISGVQGTIPEYYVISEPVELLNAAPIQKQKILKNPPAPNKAVMSKNTITKKRDDKRRATHNEVERRRRDKINSWITKLAALLPPSGLPDTASKGGILAKACDHITELTERQKRMDELVTDNEKLVMEILRLNQEMTELRKENASMRNQLADNCIVTNQRPKGQRS